MAGPKNRTVRAKIVADDAATATLRRVQGAFGALGAAATALGAYALGRALVQGAQAAVRAASESERATVALASAIRNSGQDVATTLPKYAALASQLQKQTAISDEAIATGEAMLISLGRLSGEGLERATKAALDLAASGTDVNAAFMLIAKAAAGNTAALGRYGIVIDTAGTKAEKLEKTLTELERLYGGRAAAMLDTYQGRVDAVSLAWDDLLEVLGANITQSPAVRQALTEIANALSSVTQAVSGAEGMATMKAIVVTLADLGVVAGKIAPVLINAGLAYKALIQYVIAPYTDTTMEDVAATLQQMQDVSNRGADVVRKLEEARDRIAATSTTAIAAGAGVSTFTGAVDAAGESLSKFDDYITTGPEWPLTVALQAAGAELRNVTVEGQNVALAMTALNEAAAAGAISPLDYKLIAAALTEVAEALLKEGGVVPGFFALSSAAGTAELSMDQALQAAIMDVNELRRVVADGSYQVTSLGATMKEAIGTWAVGAVGSLSNAIATAATGGKVAWGDMLRELIRGLAAAIIQALILKAIMAALKVTGVGMGNSLINVTLFSFGGAKGAIVPGGASRGRILPGADTGVDTMMAAVRPGEAILPPELTNFLLTAAQGRGGKQHIVVEVVADIPLAVKRINERVERGNVRLKATELFTTRTER